MAADDFFARWSKRKSKNEAAPLPAVSEPAAGHDALNTRAVAKALPTLADVEGLTAESDYAAFVAKGVDEAVKRSAMKKLFALPHFNIMDGLDIYVGDYSQPDPLPPGMLEALNHAKDALNPAQFFAKPVAQLLDPVPEQACAAANPPEMVPLIPAAHTAAYPASALPDIQADPQPTLVQHPDALPSAIDKNEVV